MCVSVNTTGIKKANYYITCDSSIHFTNSKFNAIITLIKDEGKHLILTGSEYIAKELQYRFAGHGINSTCIVDENPLGFDCRIYPLVISTIEIGLKLIDKYCVGTNLYFYSPPLMFPEIVFAGDSRKRFRRILFLVKLEDCTSLDKSFDKKYPSTSRIDSWAISEQIKDYELEEIRNFLVSNGYATIDEVRENIDEYRNIRQKRLEELKKLKWVLAKCFCIMSLLDGFADTDVGKCKQCKECSIETRTLKDSEAIVLSYIAQKEGSVVIERVREVLCGMKSADCLIPGYGRLRGLSYREFWEIVFCLKNSGRIVFDDSFEKIEIRK